MKQFTPSVADALNRKQGIETVLYIGIEWADGAETFYSSTEVAGSIKSLISLGGLEMTTRVSGGSSQSVTVELSDTNGDLTTILNTVDVHKRPAKVYLSFPGVPVDQAVVLLDGEINSEIKWDEAARSLSFSILSRIESRQFGFAAEDGLFASTDPSQLTAEWPFRFGFTCSRPTVKIGNGIKGFLRRPQGVVDVTLDAKICQAQQIQCPTILGKNPDGTYGNVGQNLQVANQQFARLREGKPASLPGFAISGEGTVVDPIVGVTKGHQTGYKCNNGTLTQVFTQFDAPVPGTFYIPPQPGYGNPEATGYQVLQGKCIPDYSDDDRNCVNDKFTALCQYLRQRTAQQFWASPTLTVGGGEDFPQNQRVTILVGSIQYTGTFSGEIFTIEKVIDPAANPAQLCKTIPPYARGYRKTTPTLPTTLAACEAPVTDYELRIVGGAGEGFRALDAIDSQGFLWLPSGTEVTLQNGSTEVHIVSLVPGAVSQVMAYRKVGDIELLTQVPPSYYEVVTTDYGDLSAIEVHLDRPLSTYRDESWGAELYVTFISSLSHNPVDVIQWIAETYTDLTIDSASFSAARGALGRYPCNYYHAARESSLSTMNKIAFEARCALVISDDVLKISYLPLEPVSLRTLGPGDVVATSFSFDHTTTEELITSSRVSWQDVGAGSLKSDELENKFTVDNNVEKYGFIKSDTTYQTITNKAQALKTATFWSIRDSNTWRYVTLSVGMEHLDLESYDCVTLAIPSFPTVKCIVERVAYDPTQGVVELRLWTPILSGTSAQYLFAWPAGNNQAITYPLNNSDLPVPRVSLTPPPTSPLFVDTPNARAAATRGDRFPSDIGDTLPFNECRETSDATVLEVIEPLFDDIDLKGAAARADQVAAQNYSANVSPPGGGGGGMEDDDDLEDQNPDEDICQYEVQTQWGLAQSIGQAEGSGFDCDILPGPCKTEGTGTRCSGPTFIRTETFGNFTRALSRVLVTRSAIETGYCSWTVGMMGPVTVSGPFLVSGSNCNTVDGMISIRDELLGEFPTDLPRPSL